MSSTKSGAASATSNVVESKVSKLAKAMIPPLIPTDFSNDSVVYSSLNVTDKGFKSITTTYDAGEFVVIAKNCTVISYKKKDNSASEEVDTKNKNKKDKYQPKDKYQLFMNIKDEAFINFVETYEKSLIEIGAKHSKEWFDGHVFDEDETATMFKPLMKKHSIYGYSLSANLTNDCNVINNTGKTTEITGATNSEAALIKNSIVNIAFRFNKINIVKFDSYRVGIDIKQVNVNGVASNAPMKSNAIMANEYEKGKITFSPLDTSNKNGKKCNILYNAPSLLRISFKNVIGRLFRMEDPEGKVTYSISIRLTDPEYCKMFANIEQEIIDLLYSKRVEFYGTNKTKKQVTLGVHITSYGKDDKVRIQNGEPPKYPKSLWVKIFHNYAKSFDNKIINSETKLPITNADELVNKDLTIVDLETYVRHLWIGAQGTSINFTLNKCEISYEVPIYNMDDINSKENAKSDEEEDDEENDEEEKDVENSSNEDDE
uniref:Uncharacterized protein n=1 Tax=viral metagenome TaxID=1070528 RepID=A0A6C0HM43_9ZZZZ